MQRPTRRKCIRSHPISKECIRSSHFPNILELPKTIGFDRLKAASGAGQAEEAIRALEIIQSLLQSSFKLDGATSRRLEGAEKHRLEIEKEVDREMAERERLRRRKTREAEAALVARATKVEKKPWKGKAPTRLGKSPYSKSSSSKK